MAGGKDQAAEGASGDISDLTNPKPDRGASPFDLLAALTGIVSAVTPEASPKPEIINRRDGQDMGRGEGPAKDVAREDRPHRNEVGDSPPVKRNDHPETSKDAPQRIRDVPSGRDSR